MVTDLYLVHYGILLKNVTDIITKYDSHFIPKCDKCFIRKCDNYKMRRYKVETLIDVQTVL